jgi:hypothetical protein
MPSNFRHPLRLVSNKDHIIPTRLPSAHSPWTLRDQCSWNSGLPIHCDNDDLAIWNILSVNTFAMPHSTREPSLNCVSSKFPMDTRGNRRTSMEKFPDHVDPLDGQSPYQSSPIVPSNGFIGGQVSADRWQPRRDSALKGSGWANGHTGGHSRQKSLSDAFKTIRTRRASVSANVHEVADALKAPVSPKLIVREPLPVPPHLRISHPD